MFKDSSSMSRGFGRGRRRLLALIVGLSAVGLWLMLARPPASRAATTITVAGGADGRAAALLSVTNSGAVYNRQYNPALVLMQYLGYLRRNPDDPPDGDFSGFDFWLSKLDSFSRPGEDMRDDAQAFTRVQKAEMVRAFISSIEYRARFGP